MYDDRRLRRITNKLYLSEILCTEWYLTRNRGVDAGPEPKFNRASMSLPFYLWSIGWGNSAGTLNLFLPITGRSVNSSRRYDDDDVHI